MAVLRAVEIAAPAVIGGAMTALEQRIHQRVRRIEICTRRLSNDSFQGGVQTRFRGHGMDFDEVREYEIGDDVRALIDIAEAENGAMKLDTPAGRRVEVSVTGDEARGVLVISDTGVGIASADRPRIRDRLFRADRSRTERGLGLGLSLVRPWARFSQIERGGLTWTRSEISWECC